MTDALFARYPQKVHALLPVLHLAQRENEGWLPAGWDAYVAELCDTTVNHESFTERAPNLGGLVEFYRSPDRVRWSPTGINVPDYPKLAQLWWQQIGDVNSGAFTPQQAMDRLAGEMDTIMARMQAADEAANVYGGCGPRLNEPKDASEWIGKGGAKAKVDEKPQGQTIAYEEIIKRWQ